MQTSSLASATRRITATLFLTQSLASAALIANATVNPIVGASLSGRPALSGLPGTLLLLGAAVAAYPAGRFMQRFGRRPGLALGFLSGLIGMLVGGGAIIAHSFALFLLGLLLIGLSRGAIDQSRFAAADAAPLDQRGKAISAVVFASTIGAIGGPALVAPLGALVQNLGVERLSGSMLGGAVLFGLAGMLIVLFLRPDPREISSQMASNEDRPALVAGSSRSLRQIARLGSARLALMAMVFGQAVMVMVMTVSSLHMYDHHHGLEDVSLVIMAHTLGMYGLSVVTGVLSDRLGRAGAIALGAGVLIVGCLIAPTSLLTIWLALALFLVGLGWNLCYIAGSSLLSDSLSPEERGIAQGANDLIVNLTSALSSLGSGVVVAWLGYGILCLLGASFGAVLLAVAIWRVLASSQGKALLPTGSER